jgi:hypothetical protein
LLFSSAPFLKASGLKAVAWFPINLSSKKMLWAGDS